MYMSSDITEVFAVENDSDKEDEEEVVGIIEAP